MFVQKLEHVFDNKKLLSALSTIKKKNEIKMTSNM